MTQKKITKKMEEKFLRLIFERYRKKYGYGTRNLQDYEILLTGSDLYVDEMPELFVIDHASGSRSSLLPHILIELEAKNYVRDSNAGTDLPKNSFTYYLTEEGYKHASKNMFEHFMTYLNNNTGWAIPIAGFSLIVSILAIFF